MKENEDQKSARYAKFVVTGITWDLFILSYLTNSYQERDIELIRNYPSVKEPISKLKKHEMYKLKWILFFLAKMHKKWVREKERVLKIEKMRDEFFLFFSKNYLLKGEKESEKILDETFFKLHDKYINTNFFKHNFPILEEYKLFWIDSLSRKNDYLLNLKRITLLLYFSYDKEMKNNWDEIFLLHRLCVTYNYNLLKTLLENIISQFCISCSSEKSTLSKRKIRTTIVFTDKPDIRIILKKVKKIIEIGIEITEVFSLSSSKGSIYKLVTREAEKAEKKGKIERMVEKLKSKELKKILTLDVKREGENTYVKINFIKKAGINELMKNLVKQIKEKNKRRKEYKVDKAVLWITLSSEFSIYLYQEKDYNFSLVEDEDIQKDFLSYYLMSEVFDCLSSNKIEIEFEYLAIIFLNRNYSMREDFLSEYDPFFKNYRETFRKTLGEKNWVYRQFNKEDVKAVIPPLYIPIIEKKVKNLREELEIKKKKFLRDWKIDINSLKYSETSLTYGSFTQTKIDLPNKNEKTK